MKKLLLAIGLGMAFLACNQAPVEEGSVDISAKYAIQPGDSLKLVWWKVDGTDAYVVYDNSSGTLEPIDTLQGDTITSYIFTTPCTMVGVSTMLDGALGDPSTVDLTLTTKDSVVLYSRQDTVPDHYGYFKINLITGEITLIDSASRENSYGFIDGPPDTLSLHSSYILYENDAGVRLFRDTTASSLEDMTLAPDPSDPGWSDYAYDSAGVDINAGDLFYVWVDECAVGAPGWTGFDLFGKAEILGVSGYTITARFKFQTGIRALRWLSE